MEMIWLNIRKQFDLWSHRIKLLIRIWFPKRTRCWMLIPASLTTLFIFLIFYQAEISVQTEDISKYTCVPSNNSNGCEEGVYYYECASTIDFIFNDMRLLRHCKERPSRAEGHVDLAHMEAQVSFGPKPNSTYIRTKCTFVLPLLLSFYKASTRRENDALRVPNLVHYIWFSNKREFTFVNYISFVSADKFLEPARILIHGDVLPSGYWWNRMIQELPNIYFVKRERPVLIQGVRPKWIEHEADITRLQIIYANGGIYLDTDVLVLRSFDTLRDYELTLGEESKGQFSNGIIVAQPHSPFICVWLNSYRQYPKGKDQWNTFSIRYPYLLSFLLANHLHVEKSHLIKPNMYSAKEKMYEGYFDWSNNYAVHVWHKLSASDMRHIPKTSDDVMQGLNSISEIINYIVKATPNS